MCIFSDALLEARGTIEATSAPEPIAQKPPSTPDTDARETEDMVNSMLLDSPLPNAERSHESSPRMKEARSSPREEEARSLWRKPPQASLLCLFSNFLFLLVH